MVRDDAFPLLPSSLRDPWLSSPKIIHSLRSITDRSKISRISPSLGSNLARRVVGDRGGL
ncbi:hypothetical protein C4D60_Mb02t01020 [Musa balbisiana]|uniref:Uncharacterized protein n=1 Tax=Musa balbisiana TaxID=52838 RepID=A0A4S8I7D1_MUSBA|nr:hypothetical protein C4D60_Mb02t01020 [Musa balbisiana]